MNIRRARSIRPAALVLIPFATFLWGCGAEDGAERGGGADAGDAGDAGDPPPTAEEPSAGPANPDDPLLDPTNFRDRAPDEYRVRLETTEGPVLIQVHRDWSPRGADRFYNLVRAGFYDGMAFHRVLEEFSAGFGIHADPYVNYVWRRQQMRDDPRQVSNTRGRVAFAKAGPDSRTVQVFVNLKDNSGQLDDEGFTPFGEVVEGMDNVDALYSGYGDGPPRGEGVYQAMAIARGEEYLAEFPELDRIEDAEVVEGGGPGEGGEA